MLQYPRETITGSSPSSTLEPAGCRSRKLIPELPELYELQLPAELQPTEAEFERLWNLHPSDYHKIRMHGREIPTPRWQQAFGADYHYTGRTNRALPLDDHLTPVLDWARQQFDDQLNGLLLDWYEPDLRHYIGPHRDSTVNMVAGAPIVMISLGDARTFRLRPWKGRGYADYAARNGTVFVLPWATNGAFTHEVLRPTKGQQGRRISITARAFVGSP